MATLTLLKLARVYFSGAVSTKWSVEGGGSESSDSACQLIVYYVVYSAVAYLYIPLCVFLLPTHYTGTQVLKDRLNIHQLD